MENATSDLFSKDPKVLARVADETISYLKEQLAEFDAKQAEHFDRLTAYMAEARDRERWERAEDLADQRDEYHRTWMRAREPMVQQIIHIERAKAEVMPPRMIFLAKQPA